MQRGSGRVSAHRDDEMKHEVQGLLRSGRPTRTEEWHDPEPAAEDDPRIAGGPVAPGGCEHRSAPLSGSRPTAILKAGSARSASQSLPSG